MENTVYGDGTTPANFARFDSVLQAGEIVDRPQPCPETFGLVRDEIFGAYGIECGFALQSHKLLITSTDGP